MFKLESNTYLDKPEVLNSRKFVIPKFKVVSGALPLISGLGEPVDELDTACRAWRKCLYCTRIDDTGKNI